MTVKAEARAELVRRAREELALRAARRQMREFVPAVTVDYLMGWAHEEICAALDEFLQAVLDKRSPRLIICMPPRSGKSQLASRAFPAFALGKAPDLSIIASSYSADLSSRFNRDVQRIIDSERYKQIFPGTRLCDPHIRYGERRYVRTSDLFEVVGRAGVYRSAGVGGGITGQGADILIIDDPIKDRAGAGSAAVRQGIWDWYTSTAYTRLSPGGGVIVMATRWHMDDLIGRLLEAARAGEGDQFRVLSFPAVAEHDEEHRRAGEALHPERYDLKRLEAIRRTIGAADWAALYQQSPVPEGGAVFRAECFRRWNERSLPPRFEQVITSWDMTFKDTAAADFVVGQVWGRRGVQMFLLDQVRGRWDFGRTLAAFSELAGRWPGANRHLIEDKANGSAIISVLKNELHGVTPITPRESKTERAQAVIPMIEGGNVCIPDTAPWLSGFEDEILTFPAGAHDDQVDAMTQALNFMREHRPITVHPANLLALRRR